MPRTYSELYIAVRNALRSGFSPAWAQAPSRSVAFIHQFNNR